ncbi:HNH endonuclease [Streptomyces sp. SA15]|nr:HNH endonuclease [Streptomyces sp. SA15]
MPYRPRRPCPAVPNCPNSISGKERACPDHVHMLTARRAEKGTSAYGKDWPRKRESFLYMNAWCVLCGQPSKVADHFPLSRKELVKRGVSDPNAHEHLRALCVRCHNRETGRNQAGGVVAERRRQSQAQREWQHWTEKRDAESEEPPF